MIFGKQLFASMTLIGMCVSNAHALTDEDFSHCIATLSAKASAEGISQSVIASSLATASLSPRVLELDRQQPEFTTTFADYFNARVNAQRIQQGRSLLAEHRTLLNKIAKQYGVAPHYLMAFWGLETNFGSYFGRMSVLDSLTTLACDTRRSEYFSGELMSVLRIIDEDSLPTKSLQGSWAGAMGHMQFMPSVFLHYAVDYDGDGKRDLWGSLPDAMASAANFLKGIGWETGTRWGREVRLPKDFPYLESGLSNQKPLIEWQRLGVRQTNGSALPSINMEASLLVPASNKGPAFLVYKNFEVIMGWNRSEFYALAVGHLADRINGAGKLYQAPPEDAPRLHRDQVIALQTQLTEKGLEVGEIDGILGPVTRRAIMHYQASQKMVSDGFPGVEVLTSLGVSFEK
jgi:membrane-bound lytic murein transglycosylase B